MKRFNEWLKARDIKEYGVEGGLPYGAAQTPPTSMATQPGQQATMPQTSLIGVPPHIVQQLQRTGPAMQGIIAQANRMKQMGTHADLPSALQAALAQYTPQVTPQPSQPTMQTGMQ